MKKFRNVFVILLCGIFCIGCVFYLLLTVYYKDRFRMNTWIDGVYCTGKTVEEVNQELASKADIPVFTILDENKKAYELSLEEVGYVLDYTSPLNHHLLAQEIFLWNKPSKDFEKNPIKPVISFDEEKLKNLFLDLPIVREENEREKDVRIQLGENGYQLIDGINHRLDLEKTYSILRKKVRTGDSNFDLVSEGCYWNLKPTKQQKELLELWDKINRFQNCGIVFDMGAEQIPLSPYIMSGFLETEKEIPKTSSENELIVNKQGIIDFVDWLGEEYDTYKKERTFESTRGETITVPAGGTYGTKIDKKAEIVFLSEALLDSGSFDGTVRTHVPTYEREGYVRGKNDIGNTYIEIDMTDQKLYYYSNGELLIETEIVTGNTSRKRGTPEGVNYVYRKQKNRTLRGPGYAAFVKYWVPVKGNIGIHDASWRKEFGGEIYKKNGSHGCINTPTEKMSELYDLVEVGTPVVMFY